ncbi:hypothetical protein EON65_22445 [archaeon]|nr:MAG: hypothetical protein EON65_22445 [archaeon]
MIVFLYYTSVVSVTYPYTLKLLMSIIHTPFTYTYTSIQWSMVSTLMVYITSSLHFSSFALAWLCTYYGISTMVAEGMGMSMGVLLSSVCFVMTYSISITITIIRCPGTHTRACVRGDILYTVRPLGIWCAMYLHCVLSLCDR